MDELTRINLDSDESLRKIHDKIEKIEDWAKLPSKPLVSICMAAYNHEKFIVSALEGILMQKTDFPYEIIIKEDKSTDNTRSILKDYQTKYPDKIRLWLCKENIYSQGLKPKIVLFGRGKYIASCEGDDYWTDPYKLQKQVQHMEKNSDCAACFTNALMVNEIDGTEQNYVDYAEGVVPVELIIMKGGGLYPTASLLFRKKHFSNTDIANITQLPGDVKLIYNLMLSGNIYFLNEVSCVYRRWLGGVYSSISNDPYAVAEKNLKEIEGYKEFNRLTFFEFDNHIKKKISTLSVRVFLTLPLKLSFKVVKDIKVSDYPTIFKTIIKKNIGW